MALKWVQKNIASFNGDPGQVTIFDNSAGGASVQFQLHFNAPVQIFTSVCQPGSSEMSNRIRLSPASC